MGIARGHQRQAHVAGHLEGPFEREPLNFQAVILNLDVVPVAEQLVKPGRHLHGFGAFDPLRVARWREVIREPIRRDDD